MWQWMAAAALSPIYTSAVENSNESHRLLDLLSGNHVTTGCIVWRFVAFSCSSLVIYCTSLRVSFIRWFKCGDRGRAILKRSYSAPFAMADFNCGVRNITKTISSLSRSNNSWIIMFVNNLLLCRYRLAVFILSLVTDVYKNARLYNIDSSNTQTIWSFISRPHAKLCRASKPFVGSHFAYPSLCVKYSGIVSRWLNVSSKFFYNWQLHHFTESK